MIVAVAVIVGMIVRRQFFLLRATAHAGSSQC
jgi:hypothetical protein